VGFCVEMGQYWHSKELRAESTISSRQVGRFLKDIGRLQIMHLGQGLYMAGTLRFLNGGA
jgi:hypothetical protein